MPTITPVHPKPRHRCPFYGFAPLFLFERRAISAPRPERRNYKFCRRPRLFLNKTAPT